MIQINPDKQINSSDIIVAGGESLDTTLSTINTAISSINTDLSNKASKTNTTIPAFTYPWGSFSEMVPEDPLDNLKRLHQLTLVPFNRGSIIHIQLAENGGYATFFIGGTDCDYFKAFRFDYYTDPYYIQYTDGTWGNVKYFSLHE